MSFLARFRWWRRWRGGEWLRINGDYIRGEPETIESFKADLEEIVGTADPDEIRLMLDQAKDSWRPPKPKLPP